MAPKVEKQKKNILIVGAGASGMACAAGLAEHSDKFNITVLERETNAGGQATSIDVSESKFGGGWLNNGVQGGSGIFRHTFHYIQQMGHEAKEVQLQISFGRGKDGFWSNVFPSHLVEKYSNDIKKFGKALKIIGALEFFFALIPVRITLRMFRFSKEFCDVMVYPLMALFLGTGNQTANVSTVILERLFTDENLKLWDYSPETLLPNLPTMYTFPRLSKFYSDWVEHLKKKGVQFRLGHELVLVDSRTKDGVVITSRKSGSEEQDLLKEHFDEIVFAVLADDAKRLLGSQASWMERNVLGSVAFYDDVTVTHTDLDYMKKHYELEFQDELAASPKSKDQENQLVFSRDEGRFQPMYFTHTYKEDPEKIEMSFDCAAYQHQFRSNGEEAKNSRPLDRHLFQTIFLDKAYEDKLWTKKDIDKDKIVEEKWWHQLGHRWQHYAKVVPWMMFLNGKHNTWFAGSWTLVV